ncbi:Arb2 domain-containing protein [Xylariaceae sp. FL0016]|nr:Arb2 domain-containing protein [Xylariaceae sp. FL0016]
MFVRKWSGLPEDPHFPSDLKELGYFINDEDEVRSIEEPDYYFKFFINRNMRYNDRQRFGMNQALQAEICTRLEKLGLKKTLLPLDSDASKPNVPIFVSADIASKSRVILIFGETTQDLGVLAHRVIGGPGGVNKGSVVSVVKGFQAQKSSATDDSPPGIILANMGELLWHPKSMRTISLSAFDAAPMRSAACIRNEVTEVNHVPGNKTPSEHVKYLFERVVPGYVRDDARLDIVGVGDGIDIAEQYLDDVDVWDRWAKRINCIAIVGGMYATYRMKSRAFRDFLKQRARAYTLASEPLGTPLSGPDGNPRTTTFTQNGCPSFSAGEDVYTERSLVAAHPEVLAWLQEVALAGPDYANPDFVIYYHDHRPVDADDPDWSAWQENEETNKPTVEMATGMVKSGGEVEGAEGVADVDGKGNGKDKGQGKDDGFVIRVESLSDTEDDE